MEPRRDHRFDPFGPGADSLPSLPVDPDSLDYNDPSHFAQLFGPNSGMPIPAYKSPEDVRREAKDRSSKIFASYDLLRGILERHEATIHKRWAKKTTQQRLKILISAWPNMATVHRPDFNAFRRESEEQRDVGTKHRDHFMWPYINQEDLTKPKALLLLLNARGRHSPPEFAGADREALHLGTVSKALVPIFLNEHTMVLNGTLTAQEYGELLAWVDHPDAFDWMVSLKQFLPGEGLLILEVQERVMTFLIECCKQILHDIPADNLTSDTFPVLPEPRLKTEGESSGFESLTVMAAEAPYRLPAKLDLGMVASLLAAKVSAAEDHIWALREDPSYFAEQLFQLKEHRQEMLLDALGDTHPLVRPGHDTLLWARIIGDLVLQAYLDLEVHNELHRQAEELQALQAQYAASISPDQDLPEKFLQSLLKFRHYLNQAAKGPMNDLKHTVVASPPMRKFFVREPLRDMKSSMITVTTKYDVTLNKIEGQLVWLLRTVWEDEYPLFLLTLPLALDELERLLDAEPQARELVSAYIAGVIGDLSIISQCLSQLQRYQPWARSFEGQLVDREKGIKDEFTKRTKPWGEMVEALKDKNMIRAVRLGNPSDKRFFYPSEKRRTKDNIEALRRAEQNLDDFWAALDEVVHRECKSIESTAVRRLLSQQRVLQRTPEWVDEPAATSKKQGKQPVLDVDVQTLYKPMSALYFGQGSEASGSGTTQVAAQVARIKTKTKGIPREAPPTDVSPESSNTPIEEAETAADIPRPDPIPVDSRALKVFKTIFFNPTVSSTPGEVSWMDFLHAMTSTGLFAAEKLYGSVWQFRKVDSTDQSSIQFHEPHPRGKIPFVVARRHGRRLNRAFGWAGDMFVLKK